MCLRIVCSVIQYLAKYGVNDLAVSPAKCRTKCPHEVATPLSKTEDGKEIGQGILSTNRVYQPNCQVRSFHSFVIVLYTQCMRRRL